MLVVIFSYNRPEMLSNLLLELNGFHDIVVIDDGSSFTNYGLTDFGKHSTVKLIRTHHEGKKGFWKKWVMARQIALGSNHNHFLFLQDDLKDIDLDTIQHLCAQPWEKNLYAIQLVNCGHSGWGYYRNGLQNDFELNGVQFKECGFVDCMYLTNRRTLEHIDIHEVPDKWFNRPDISSGVGYQVTQSMRAIKAAMMLPTPSLAFHGNHDSVMHPKERLINPLISKHQKNDKDQKHL